MWRPDIPRVHRQFLQERSEKLVGWARLRTGIHAGRLPVLMLGGPLTPESSSVEDGRQVDAAGWLVIETAGHQCCLRDDAEPLAQAPAEQFPIT